MIIQTTFKNNLLKGNATIISKIRKTPLYDTLDSSLTKTAL